MGDRGKRHWPAWWEWDLEFTEHVLERMILRKCSEVQLRDMMETAKRLREDEKPGRWIVETTHESRPWEVIVEPDYTDKTLVVITAYRLART